ncbi:MAG: phosphomethylpyrimidine synthase, partial [Opitutales bacterium]
MIQKVEDSKTAKSLFPNSKRVYLKGAVHDISVPMREISLSETKLPDGSTEDNEPVRVYDTSGPWGDAKFHGNVEKGLPKLRQHWITSRKDVEVIEGRDVKPLDNGFLSDKHDQRTRERSQELPDFDRSEIEVLRGLNDKPVTQLHYARQGIITPEMEFVAIRENMKLQTLREKLQTSPDAESNSLNH